MELIYHDSEALLHLLTLSVVHSTDACSNYFICRHHIMECIILDKWKSVSGMPMRWEGSVAGEYSYSDR